MTAQRLRCAIYTRKSHEEGLDQDFNSLDAQREACEAYIASQRHEGWHLIRARYDDGGVSGGTMERLALQRLLADIKARKVDAVVVYKVDRLTRSLADFARIVERLDTHGVSFVSITQQFNTTTSMGRLTLNMLLSFAQFEREVTGERIRDKIAASKRKGLWMGGVVPLGYDVVDRKLVVNEAEAETVRTLFRLYLKLSNVRLVKQEADQCGLLTKLRTLNNRRRQGAAPFTSGHLYKLLSNPVYMGDITHKGERHPGQHEAIIDCEAWEAAQAQLHRNAGRRQCRTNAKHPSLLAGLLYDGLGRPMKPSHAVKAGRRYRYYITRPSEDDPTGAEAPWRLPAPALESAAIQCLGDVLRDQRRLIDLFDTVAASTDRQKGMLSSAARLADRLAHDTSAEQVEIVRELVERIDLGSARMGISLRASAFGKRDGATGDRATEPERDAGANAIQVDLPIQLRQRGVETRLIIAGDTVRAPKPDPRLVSAVAQGRCWFANLRDRTVSSVLALAERHRMHHRDVSRILPLGLLAPDIVEAILAGRQPADLTVSRLKRLSELPISWHEQRRILGFG